MHQNELKTNIYFIKIEPDVGSILSFPLRAEKQDTECFFHNLVLNYSTSGTKGHKFANSFLEGIIIHYNLMTVIIIIIFITFEK